MARRGLSRGRTEIHVFESGFHDLRACLGWIAPVFTRLNEDPSIPLKQALRDSSRQRARRSWGARSVGRVGSSLQCAFRDRSRPLHHLRVSAAQRSLVAFAREGRISSAWCRRLYTGSQALRLLKSMTLVGCQDRFGFEPNCRVSERRTAFRVRGNSLSVRLGSAAAI